MPHARRTVPFVICLTVAVGGVAHGGSVKLKSSVRLPTGAEAVRLADVADLEGEDARPLGDIVIAEVERGDAVLEISINQIRQRLDAAGVHWGKINLSGRSVVVRPRRGLATAPTAMAPASIVVEDERPRRERTDREAAHRLAEEPTLRGAIARQIVRGLRVEPEHLQLVFDIDDRELLASSARTYRFELAPQSSLASELVTFKVRLWSGGEVAGTASISVRPLVRVTIAVLDRDLARNEPIGPQDFTTRPQWLPPPQAALTCDAGEVAGRVAARRLSAGEAVRHRQVRDRTIVRRGDRIMVRCLVGGVVISLAAEARADAARGETIEFRKPGERRTFLATVTDPGEAVVDLARSRPGS